MANKPSYLTGGAGSGGSLSAKRGTEDLDFFIGDEALAAASGPGRGHPGVEEAVRTDAGKDTAYITLCGMDRLRTG